MIRLAFILTVLSAPAFAGGPAWTDQITAKDAATRTTGTISACTTAVKDPTTVTTALTTLGWARVDEYDGNASFQSQNTYLMFAEDTGFCMFETSDFNTETLTALLATKGITPSGEDADGCTQFTINATTATLTGGGNDPTCTSPTEAALRFEPAS